MKIWLHVVQSYDNERIEMKDKNIKWAKLMMWLIQDGWKRAQYIKKHGLFYSMGDNVYWHTRDLPSEPYLVKLGNNVQVAANVRLITHDRISKVINSMPEYAQEEKIPFYYGKIVIGDNVMVGANSTILYNVTIGSNVIIAAGSIVTKDVPSGSVVGGNPAKVIGDFEQLVTKRRIVSADIPRKSEGVDKIVQFFGRND